MITRFFKRKPKAEKPKKAAAEKPKRASAPEKPAPACQSHSPSKKLLTAEGWKRLMMRRASKVKK